MTDHRRKRAAHVFLWGGLAYAVAGVATDTIEWKILGFCGVLAGMALHRENRLDKGPTDDA